MVFKEIKSVLIYTLDTNEEFSDRGSVHIDETVDGLTLGQISNDRIEVFIKTCNIQWLQVREE